MLNKITTTSIAFLVSLAFFVVFTNSAQAGTWSNGNGTAIWNDVLNWNNCGGGVPGASDTVVFDGAVSSASLDLDINPGTTIAGFTMESDYSGTLDMNTNGLTINGTFTKAGGTIEMNNGGDYFAVTGDASITGGTFAITVGYFTVTSGSFTVSGDNTFQMGSGSYPVLTINGAGPENISVSGTGNYIGRAANIAELDIIMGSVSDVITITSSVQLHNVQVYEGTLALSDGIIVDMDGIFIGQNGGKLQMGASTITLGRDNLIPGGNAIYHIQSGFTESITGGTISIEGAGHGTYGAAYFENGSTYTPTGGVLSFVGDDTAALYSAEADDADFNLYSLTVGDGTNAKILSIDTDTVLDLDLDGTLTISTNATFDSNAENILVGGSWTNNNIYIHDNNQVTFNGSGTQTIAGVDSDNDDFYDVVLAGGTMSIAANYAGAPPDMEVDNDFTLSSGTLDFNASFLKVRNDFSKNGGNIIMDQGTAAIEVDNDYTITADAGSSDWSDGYTTVSGDVAISGDNTFVYGGVGHPIFTINGTGDFTISVTGANNFFGTLANEAEVDVNLGTAVSSLTMSSALTIRDLQVYKGIFDTNSNDLTVYRVFVMSLDGATSVFNMASGTFTLGSDDLAPTLVSIWHQEANSTANITGGTITIEGIGHSSFGAMFIEDGSVLNATGGTFQFIGNDDSVIDIEESDVADFNLYNLILGDATNSQTITLSASSTINFDINNDLTINANATLDANGEPITLAGDWTNSGTFTHSNNTVTFDHADTASPNNTQTITGNTTFYNFSKDCSSFSNAQELLFGGSTSINNLVTIKGKSGTLLTLNSTDDDASPTRFNIDFVSQDSAIRDLEYLTVRNSNQNNLLTIADLSADGESTLYNSNSGWTVSASSNSSSTSGGVTLPPGWSGDNNSSDEDGTETFLLDGDLVKEENNITVYLIEGGYKKPIANEYTFLYFAYKWSDVIEVDDLGDYPTGATIKVDPPEENDELIDSDLSQRLRGKILLQVENHGEAWYVRPDTGKRMYMADGKAAYSMMRNLGLGITNLDIAKIPVGFEDRFKCNDFDGDELCDKLEDGLGTDPTEPDSDGDGFNDGIEVRDNQNPLGSEKMIFDIALASRLKGKILLQVEAHGEAWYINPDDGKRYYMSDGPSAYQIMRYLSLGISNADLAKIAIED